MGKTEVLMKMHVKVEEKFKNNCFLILLEFTLLFLVILASYSNLIFGLKKKKDLFTRYISH